MALFTSPALKSIARFLAPRAQPTPFAAYGQRFFSAGTYLDPKIVEERVMQAVANFKKVDPAKVTPTAHLQTDLGLDSLDLVEVTMAFEDEFAVEIPDQDAEKLVSIADAVKYISSHPHAK
eukprot:GILK01001180.1.p1 GENE.GILK01001180.1~~GILK01001180.1.p1  ORF type:complete len:121 (+),score=22.31 GILK01001180.1:64-426(+)